MQPGEGQLHLRLHANRAQYLTARRLSGQVFQQCGLAHPRLTVHHQYPALFRPNGHQQPIEHLAFGTSAVELARAGTRSHRPALRYGASALPVTAPVPAPARTGGKTAVPRTLRLRMPTPPPTKSCTATAWQPKPLGRNWETWAGHSVLAG